MVVPLCSGERCYGVLTLDRTECETYPQNVVDLVEVYCQLLATALQNAEQRTDFERLHRQDHEHAKLLEAQLLEAPLDRRRDLELIKELVHQHTRGLALYKCDNCGFRARQFYWHCPACAAWETYAPRRTEEKGLAA